ncbi:MAG: hypothetical protein JW951_02880 [Lentisphaerae bacterium]|nr:hypothetical protein [Lentisphaerota bacterium]
MRWNAFGMEWLLDTARMPALQAALVGVGVLLVVIAYLRGLRWQHHTPGSRRLLLLLRLGAIACLLPALLQLRARRRVATAQRPVVAVVLDDSGSMRRPAGAPGDEAAPTRYARALDLLRDELAPALGTNVALRVYGIDGEALSPPALETNAADKAYSPLTETLLYVQRDAGETNLAALVVLSDGAEHGAAPTPAAPDRLRVPVFAVNVSGTAAPEEGPPDAAVRSVAVNRTALAGNTVQVEADIRLRGETVSARTPVHVLQGERVVAGAVLESDHGERQWRVQMEFVPEQAGRFTYLVQAGAFPGETELADNRTTFSLAVRREPLKVLYIDGVLRWEGKFVREALARDPDIHVVYAVRTARPGRDQGSPGLLRPEALADLQLVILGDVEAAYFDPAELEALAQWIVEQGGALLLTGGYRSFGPEGFSTSRLSRVLPVLFAGPGAAQIEDPFPLRLTRAGREHPVFDLTGNRMRDVAFIHDLPLLQGCSAVRGVKPGAEVLAVNPEVQVPGRDEGLPVMAVQQVGEGRTMVFAVDTTWRWRMVVGGYTGDASFYHRFWGQLVRWLITDEDTEAAVLAVRTDRSRYRTNETVRLYADLAAAASEAGAGPGPARVRAVAADEQGRQRDLALRELSAQRYEAAFTVDRPGRWDITVTADGVGEGAASQVVRIDVARPGAEQRHAAAEPERLRALCEQSGGRYVGAEEAAALARGLAPPARRITETRELALWRHPVLAALFFACLCGEWIVRRMKRLA